jgi:hypothetical protein
MSRGGTATADPSHGNNAQIKLNGSRDSETHERRPRLIDAWVSQPMRDR